MATIQRLQACDNGGRLARLFSTTVGGGGWHKASVSDWGGGRGSDLRDPPTTEPRELEMFYPHGLKWGGGGVVGPTPPPPPTHQPSLRPTHSKAEKGNFLLLAPLAQPTNPKICPIPGGGEGAGWTPIQT